METMTLWQQYAFAAFLMIILIIWAYVPPLCKIVARCHQWKVNCQTRFCAARQTVIHRTVKKAL